MLRAIQDFFDWLRDVFGTAAPSIKPLREWSRASTTGTRYLHLYLDESSDVFPGVVGVWLIGDTDADKDLLFLCLNVAQVRSWLFQYKPGEGDLHRYRRVFEVQARKCLKEQEQAGIKGSHLVLVGWISKTLIRKKYRTLECTGVWLVDFQGVKVWLGSNTAAKRICELVVYKLYNLTEGEYYSWQQIIEGCVADNWEGVPWIPWFDFYSKKILGELHVLQPKYLPKSQR